MKYWSLVFATAALLSGAGISKAQQAPTPEEMDCVSLRGLSIAADKIGEPSGGADIYAATLARGPEAAGGAFCKVLGGIDPVDPVAPDINFEINLPLIWNDKAIQYGGGGYDGQLIEAIKNRAGSGNLDSGDKWNFCLTSA